MKLLTLALSLHTTPALDPAPFFRLLIPEEIAMRAAIDLRYNFFDPEHWMEDMPLSYALDPQPPSFFANTMEWLQYEADTLWRGAQPRR